MPALPHHAESPRHVRHDANLADPRAVPACREPRPRAVPREIPDGEHPKPKAKPIETDPGDKSSMSETVIYHSWVISAR